MSTSYTAPDPNETYAPRELWPQWLRDASTSNARVIISGGSVLWLGGTWHCGTWCEGAWRGGDWHGGEWLGGHWRDGEWHGGTWNGGEWRVGDWHGGTWLGGDWLDGNWHCGEWHDGMWYGGHWYDGRWLGGEWLDGKWHGGEWHCGKWLDGEWVGGKWHGGHWHGGEHWYGGKWLGGEWHGGDWLDWRYDRLTYHAALCGIVFDEDGYAVAYRTTQANGRGRLHDTFIQPEGEYYEDDALQAGSGTCCKGIHVASAAVAWTYFGINTTCQFWRVRFHRRDLLDCDGQKARIRGGHFTKIDNPFAKKETNEY